MRTFTPAAMDVKRITNSYITMWLCGFSSFDYSCNSYKITCKAKPDCSPPGGYPPHRLLVINRWANWFVCVRRSTCTSCRISSHASVGKMSEVGYFRAGNVRGGMSEGEMSRGGNYARGNVRSKAGAMSVPRCIGVVSRNCRRSTSCIILTMVERVVAECTRGHQKVLKLPTL